MSLKCIALNCTLKKSPQPSHTESLMRKVLDLMASQGVEFEIVRVVDHNIPFGVSSDEGPGDEWPGILEGILASDIVMIGMPIWFGVRSSVAQLVIERLDGTYNDADPETGQYPLYGKVGCCVVTGNEDGAHDCAANTLFNLSHLGCVIPPNSDCYWVGDAGPGPSYMDSNGDKHMYTNKTARWVARNTVFMANLIKSNPIPTNLKVLTEDAKAYSES